MQSNAKPCLATVHTLHKHNLLGTIANCTQKLASNYHELSPASTFEEKVMLDKRQLLARGSIMEATGVQEDFFSVSG